MKITANWLRSVPGQMCLLACLFGGAIVLAGTALFFRPWFEGYAKQTEPALPKPGQCDEAALTQIQQTLAVGSPEQRRRACALLAFAEGDAKLRAIELTRYAKQKAERRGEADLANEAGQVLAQLTES